ncbi:hypothetical protein AAVH_09599 [Aphelenchoides avenae]|nr:hypothetical protein AAVH_09599 [Aphelenchus avenae]
MRYDTYTLVSLSVEVCLWLFHLSVFVAIATQVVKRVYPFNSAFYKLYVLQSVFDFLNFLNFTLIIRFNFLALLPKSFNTSNSRLGMIQMLYSGYTVNFGHFCQVVLALNRFTAFLLPLRHNEIWSRRNVAITFGILLLLPASMTVVNFFVHIEPVPVDFGHIIVDVNPISSRVRYAPLDGAREEGLLIMFGQCHVLAI